MGVLVKAYPEGLNKPNGAGSYPLHLLCDYGAKDAETLRVVLQYCNTARQVDTLYQCKPLHILRNNSMNEIHHSLSMLRTVRMRIVALKGETEEDNVTEDNQDTIAQLEQSLDPLKTKSWWQKASLLIQAESVGTGLPDDTSELIVHACIRTQCPSSMLEYALLLYPEQLLEKDVYGQYPIHIAAAMSQRSVVWEILHVQPASASLLNDQGRLPLEVLMMQNQCSGVGALLAAAHPQALEVLNVEEGLYPMLWKQIYEQGGIDALYQAVQAKPSIFQNH